MLRELLRIVDCATDKVAPNFTPSNTDRAAFMKTFPSCVILMRLPMSFDRNTRSFAAPCAARLSCGFGT